MIATRLAPCLLHTSPYTSKTSSRSRSVAPPACSIMSKMPLRRHATPVPVAAKQPVRGRRSPQRQVPRGGLDARRQGHAPSGGVQRVHRPCPKIQLPCLVTGSGRASPGLSLVTQNKQSLLTGREVRDAQRRRPLCLEGSSSCVARYPPKAVTLCASRSQGPRLRRWAV